jgi:AcrR family transcriptional regulator
LFANVRWQYGVPIAFVNRRWQTDAMTRKPRKPRRSDRTRAAIFEAARALFAERGYDGATIRDIAGHAAIDPSMVMRYFGSKDELFAATTTFDLRLPDLSAVARDEIGAALVRHFLEIWEGRGQDSGFPILLRSAASNARAATKMREVFGAQVMPMIAKVGRRATAGKRAGLVAAQILGLALARYVLKLPPMVDMSADDVVRHVGPAVQRYLES